VVDCKDCGQKPEPRQCGTCQKGHHNGQVPSFIDTLL
jgi:hypothetical protein